MTYQRELCRAAALVTFIVTGIFAAALTHAESVDPFVKLEAEGVVIRDVLINRINVFDTSKPGENKGFYRAANSIHWVTRESVIRGQLLFKPEDRVSAQKVEESERLLRRNNYIYDVTIEPLPVSDGVVDIRVTTRDNWTLSPQLNWQREAGQTEYYIGIEEKSIFGTGSAVSFIIEDDGDRTSSLFGFNNDNLAGGWWGMTLGYRDSSDGDAQRFRLQRPFYSLDSRWTAGIDVGAVDQQEPVFSFGDEATEYRRDETRVFLSAGRSRGLQGSWTRRWTTGLAIEDSRFEPVPALGEPSIAPESRDLRYPWVRFEAIENRFIKTRNLNRIDVTEDLQVGRRFSALIGWFGHTLGSDRDGAIMDFRASGATGNPDFGLFSWSAGASGRLETGDFVNGRFRITANLIRRQSDKRSYFLGFNSVIAHEPDLDSLVPLGGQTGLRGFDREYANGDARFVATLEQRYITDWYPFKIFRIGAAAFVDAGRVWGKDALGRQESRWLSDVGVGLRLMSTRAESNRMFHIDFAYPMQRGDGIDRGVQILLEAKRGF
ncbi:MAG: BamA/TamA family outer membrane protein [Pseudomonadota bacterium]